MKRADKSCTERRCLVFLMFVAMLVFSGMAGCRSAPKTSDATPALESEGTAVAARINGESLSHDALVRQYDLYFTLSGNSGEYKQEVSLEAFLGRYLLEILLLREARGTDTHVDPEAIEAERTAYLKKTNLSEKELSDRLAQAGLGMADADRFFENNLVIDQWSRTKFSELSVSDEEALVFYNENPDLFIRDPDNPDAGAIPFEAVRDAVRESLTTTRIQSALFNYAMELRDTADIQLYNPGNEAGSTAVRTDARDLMPAPEAEPRNPDRLFPTFEETGLDPCTDESGRPLILLFSASSCAHCQWVGGVFDLVAGEYAGRGLVVAHHYDVETGDDLLTETVETRIPEEHLSIGKRGDPEGYLPYFNFGCRFDRIGTGYEEQDDLAAEAEEMSRVIEALLP